MLVCQTANAAFDDIQRIYRQAPSLAHFEVCQGGGCAKVTTLSLNAADWRPVVDLFRSLPENAAMERHAISHAIGLLEVIVGNKTGTASDRAGTFGNADYPNQQDCNDESINTTTYIRLLKQQGYVQFHEVVDLETRNFFFNGWPHTTAVIREIDTGARYAVDSWFYDNGHRAVIVPIEVWEDDYQPEDSPIGQPRED
jgi:hypothetical protein